MCRILFHEKHSCSLGRASRRGLTLVEVILSLGILTLVILFALTGVMGVVRGNRLQAVVVMAEEALNAQIEEVVSVAADNAAYGNLAQGVIHYYANTFPANASLPLGPGGSPVPRVELDAAGGRLLYRFCVPVPDDSLRYDGPGGKGGLRPSPRAVGTMVLYLDESRVGPSPGETCIWEELGKGSARRVRGFDLDRNGVIEARRQPLTLAEVKKAETLGILQMPVDISVVCYSCPAQKTRVYSAHRRFIVTEDREMQAGGGK